jgi:hypothetical protein
MVDCNKCGEKDIKILMVYPKVIYNCRICGNQIINQGQIKLNMEEDLEEDEERDE